MEAQSLGAEPLPLCCRQMLSKDSLLVGSLGVSGRQEFSIHTNAEKEA